MILTPVNREEVKGYKHTKLQAFLYQFIESGVDIARIDNHNYPRVSAAASNINQAAKRFGIKTVRAFSHNGNIYLERVMPDEK